MRGASDSASIPTSPQCTRCPPPLQRFPSPFRMHLPAQTSTSPTFPQAKECSASLSGRESSEEKSPPARCGGRKWRRLWWEMEEPGVGSGGCRGGSGGRVGVEEQSGAAARAACGLPGHTPPPHGRGVALSGGYAVRKLQRSVQKPGRQQRSVQKPGTHPHPMGGALHFLGVMRCANYNAVCKSQAGSNAVCESQAGSNTKGAAPDAQPLCRYSREPLQLLARY